MKLASYKKGRDGRLMIVSRDLKHCVSAEAIAPTMQDALDEWDIVQPQLQSLYAALNSGGIEAQEFDETQCMSPLPRAYQIADGSAYLHHVELVRKARGAEMPPSFLEDPLMYQAVSDTTLCPHANIPVSDEKFGIDFEGEVAVIVDDVPAAIPASDVLPHIKLVMLMNDVSLRGLIPNELGKGFGFFNAKPPSAFSPVAVTPDELGDKWQDGRLHLPLISTLNGKEQGRPNAGIDMQFGFDELVAHAAKTRPLGAGAIIGSGTVSNKQEESGVTCLAETRMIETIENGKPSTPFMSFGDTVRIEMLDGEGNSIFGAIEQTVERYEYVKGAAPMKEAC
jgi:fumarylacetoacetate (FAA) hydrolase